MEVLVNRLGVGKTSFNSIPTPDNRNLFLAFKATKVNGKSIISQLNKEVGNEFTTLSQRTFFDVKTQHEISN